MSEKRCSLLDLVNVVVIELTWVKLRGSLELKEQVISRAFRQQDHSFMGMAVLCATGSEVQENQDVNIWIGIRCTNRRVRRIY